MKNYMDKFTVLCGLDLQWGRELEEEFKGTGISAGYADNIGSILDIFPGTQIDIIICSSMEFYSFLEYEGTEIFEKYIMKKGIPVMVITDRYSASDELKALHLGCFDYQTNQVPVKIIAQRIKNRLEYIPYSYNHKACVPDIKRLYFDGRTGSLYYHGKLIKLTRREKDVLGILVRHHGEPVEKEIILQKAWGDSFKGNIRVIDTIIKQLRKKLAGYNADIITHYGRGISINFKE